METWESYGVDGWVGLKRIDPSHVRNPRTWGLFVILAGPSRERPGLTFWHVTTAAYRGSSRPRGYASDLGEAKLASLRALADYEREPARAAA